tara:strand:+ start:1303 stop:1551 length:249 start_codon:yes stop_codon:yes gene_type:complete
MDVLVIVIGLLIIYISCIILLLILSMIVGCFALIVNESKLFCWCCYCNESSIDFREKQEKIESKDVIVIVNPTGSLNLGYKL